MSCGRRLHRRSPVASTLEVFNMADRFTARAAALAASLLAPYLLAACASLAPDLREPLLDLPPAWPQGAPMSSEAFDSEWWTMFQDPILERLVSEALTNNRDV